MTEPTVDDYLNKLTPDQRAPLEHIRALIKQHVPAAKEGISYAMPGFK